MDQIGDNHKDIVIRLGESHQDSSNGGSVERNIYYNISEFLRLHEYDEALSCRKANADHFIQRLNAKINIDTTDPRYSHIYQGIDTIVKRVVSELTKLDSFFAEVRLRQTGSSMSGVKVGLPHESDYVLELPRGRLLGTGEAFYIGTLFPLVKQIVANHARALTEGLNGHWMIHGVKSYDHIGGVCLVMHYRSSAKETNENDVGVTVDLVPVYIMETTERAFSVKAEAFLQHSLAEYAAKGDLYSVLDFFTEADITNNDKCDTGIIENTIMKHLPEDTKRVFRCAKYLISQYFASSEIPFDDIETLDKKTRQRLYGRKPYISSYRLRVHFLQLLLHVHGTEAEKRLKDGVLILCLFDILKLHVCELDPQKLTDYFFAHPLLKGCDQVLGISFPLNELDNVKRLIEKDNSADVVEELSLLNNNVPYKLLHM